MATPDGGLPWSAAIPAFSFMGMALLGLFAYVRHLVKENDKVERAFREHLEHDARLYRGERDRRASPHHVTGRQDLDERRAETETISKQIPPDVMKRIREAIDRGELPRSF